MPIKIRKISILIAVLAHIALICKSKFRITTVGYYLSDQLLTSTEMA